MKRGGRLSPTSKKRLAELKLRPAIREAVFARDGGCLMSPWRSDQDWGTCYGILTPHHVLKASQGGEYTEDNLITLCAHHNNALESDADMARRAEAAGFVQRRYPA